MHDLNFPVIKKPIWYGIAVFIITALLTFGIAYQSYLIRENEKRNEVLKEMHSVNLQLKNALNNGLSASKTLAFIISKYGFPKDFESVAKNILESNKYIDALELTKKGVITNIYPLRGNEDAIGFDVLGDSLANKEAYKAIKKKEFYFAGPLELKQGGVAVVGRLPIFIDNQFVGFAVVIIKLSTLLQAADINLQSEHFIYQLSKKNTLSLKEDFFLATAVPFDTLQSVALSVPNGEWKLYVMNKDNKMPFEIMASCFLGFLLSLTAALFTIHLTKKTDEQINSKTKELVSLQTKEKYHEMQLAEIQEIGKIGSWETNLLTLKLKWSKETFRIFELDERNFTVTHPNFLKFVHAEDLKKVDDAFVDSMHNNTLNILEHRIVTKEGKIKYVEERWRIFRNEEGKAVKAIGTCRDITELKKTELALKESEKKYKYLFEHNPMPMALFDFKTRRVIDCNIEVLMKYGYTRDEFLNLTINDLRPEEDVPLIEAALKSEEVFGAIHKKSWRHKKKNGELMFMNVSAHLIDYLDKRVVFGLLDDITEKVKAEEKLKNSNTQLQKLTAHLQIIREEERTSIAREIHDELGQQLTAIKIDTSWVSKKLITDNTQIAERISNMLRLIDDTIKTVRRISSDLRPGILDDLGLIAALEWQGEDYEKRTGIKWRFHPNVKDIAIDPKISTNLFRIFQEAFTNIIRHSGATEVDASVELKDENLILVIKDNGQGFDVDVSRKNNSWGIIGMKERAIIINAELIIESEKLKGTTVTLKVPMIKNQL